MSPSSTSTAITGTERLRAWLWDSLVAGVVAGVPVLVALWIFNKLVLSMDGVLALLPEETRSITWTPPWLDAPIPFLKTPGLGFLLSLVVLILIGGLARGILGRRVVQWLTSVFAGVPVLGTIYTATRQLVEAVFSSRAQQFQRVVLVPFPHSGSYCLGFLTAEAWTGVQEAVDQRLVSVFVPTTPNPTSGFFVMFPESRIQVLDMTVEEAFKAIMSSGIVTPSAGGVLKGVEVADLTRDTPTLDEEVNE